MISVGVGKDRQETMQASCALICNRLADAADDDAMREIVTDQLMPWWHAHAGFDATSDGAIEAIARAQKFLIHVEAINITANIIKSQTKTPLLDAAMAIAYWLRSGSAIRRLSDRWNALFDLRQAFNSLLHDPGEQLGQAGGVGLVLGLPRLERRAQAHRADAPPGRVQP